MSAIPTADLARSAHLTTTLFRDAYSSTTSNRPGRRVTVLAIDAPPVASASNTLIPFARAKVGLRVPPGADNDSRAHGTEVSRMFTHC